ncbi:hypothetical protein [Spartinivicinus poritis]|uniref:Copper resistance protein n=1 Tax=Spartinivicinus poritis TaxID=2994640 RepID=A0ABT5U3E3_9GAMM|nr:hypothetical protein [Spartinivicinus sp. A2-2]MDE1460881.1 hypothetical protein [Spartinivicinus sp. A2-2]
MMLNKLRQQRSHIALTLLAMWVMLHLVGCLTVWVSTADTDVMASMDSSAIQHHMALAVSGDDISYTADMACSDTSDTCQSMNKWQSLLQLPLEPLFALLLIIPCLQLLIGPPIGLAIRQQQLRYVQASPPINLRHCCWLK